MVTEIIAVFAAKAVITLAGSIVLWRFVCVELKQVVSCYYKARTDFLNSMSSDDDDEEDELDVKPTFGRGRNVN